MNLFYLTSGLETHLQANSLLLEELKKRNHNIIITQQEEFNSEDIILSEQSLPNRDFNNKNQTWILLLHGISPYKTWGHLVQRYDLTFMPTKNWINVYTSLVLNGIEPFNIYATNGWSKFDIYYQYLQDIKRTKEYIYNKYNFDSTKKLIVYAPTGVRPGFESLKEWREQGWRDEEYINHGSYYFKDIIEKTIQNFGNLYTISHPCVYRSDIIKDRIPIMVAADLFVGDISSMTLEFSLINKPIIQIQRKPEDRFPGDFHFFNKEHGELLDFGDIIDIKDLDITIKNRLIYDQHKERRNYLKDKYVGLCDGLVARREADIIEGFCKKIGKY